MDSQVSSGFVQRFQAPRPVKVIAVCSGKGGVGKTNVAANVAIALSADGHNVALLDADLSLANIDVLLGLQPRFNLSHVLSGEVDVADTLLKGPRGVRIIPASSGNFDMSKLDSRGQATLINAFSQMSDQPDVLVVDTAAGISPSVARFVKAAQYPVVVLRDEPASLTDAYALIKVFSRNYGMHRFHIVTNQSQGRQAGRRLFAKLDRVADSYLDVVLRHTGDIPQDDYVVKAVQQQCAVTDAYPNSPAGRAFRTLARTLAELPSATKAHGGLQFFMESLVMADATYKGKVA